jgi:hypothetical protein
MSPPSNAAAGGPQAAEPTQSSNSPSTNATSSTSSVDSQDQLIGKIVVISILSVYGLLLFITVVAWIIRLGVAQARLPPKPNSEGYNLHETEDKLNDSTCSDTPLSKIGVTDQKRRRYRQSPFNLSRDHRRDTLDLPKLKSPAHPLALGPDSLEMERNAQKSFSLDLERNAGESGERYHAKVHSLLDDSRPPQPLGSPLTREWELDPAIDVHPSAEAQARNARRPSRPRPAPITIFPTIKASPLPSPNPITPTSDSPCHQKSSNSPSSIGYSIKSPVTSIPDHYTPTPRKQVHFSHASAGADHDFVFHMETNSNNPPQLPTLSVMEDGRF